MTKRMYYVRMYECTKKIFCLLFLVCCLLSVSGCDFRIQRDYKTLVYHVNVDPPTLNRLTQNDAVASSIENFLYDPLLERDNETLEFKPKIVKKWTVSPDHLEYTFYMRDDVFWHDGVKMTAEDVIFSYNQIQNPKVDAAPLRVYFRDVSKVEKIDDFTIKFSYAYPYFRALSILSSLPVIPKHIFEGTDINKNPAGRHPIGNGPYKFKEWNTGKNIIVTRNENYWSEKPEIMGIVFQVITDRSVALQVLKKVEMDMGALTPIQWVRQTESKKFNKRFNKYKYFQPNYSYIAWNQGRPYFKDARVRRAMTMLIDREKIKNTIYYGLVEIVTGNFYKFGNDYNNDMKPLTYNPQMAVKLLDEAGWIDHNGDGIRDKDGVDFEFTFMTAGSKSSERISNILREELSKIGIVMEVSKFEWAVFSKNLHDRAFDATMLGWSMPFESDPFQVWHSSQTEKGSNFIGFQNKEADKIIEAARREFDPEVRRKLFQRFHEIIHEEQPYTFLFMNPSLVAVEKRFENIKVYKAGLDIREWKPSKPEKKLYE